MLAQGLRKITFRSASVDMPLSLAMVRELPGLIAHVRENPQDLDQPSLQPLKSLLLEWGASIPRASTTVAALPEPLHLAPVAQLVARCIPENTFAWTRVSRDWWARWQVPAVWSPFVMNFTGRRIGDAGARAVCSKRAAALAVASRPRRPYWGDCRAGGSRSRGSSACRPP